MIALERKRYILNALKEKGIINLREIAKELNMAEITIRRDFEKLEAGSVVLGYEAARVGK